MSDLESRLLYSNTAGYCSSSDEDDMKVDKAEDTVQRYHNEDAAASQLAPRNQWNTGPKGVLEDYRIHKAQHEKEESKKYEELVAQAKMCTLSGESENDDLEEIRRKRLLEMKDNLYAVGKIDDLTDKEQFLNFIELSQDRWVLIHIYEEDNEGCATLNKVFNTLAVRHPNFKLGKVLSSTLGLSAQFKMQGLPTLQVYRDELLVGNFIRITDQLGENFTADQLIHFLSESEIELELSKYPAYAEDYYGDDDIIIDHDY
ncbi:Phosducin family protein [Acanthocheilonema viteae]